MLQNAHPACSLPRPTWIDSETNGQSRHERPCVVPDATAARRRCSPPRRHSVMSASRRIVEERPTRLRCRGSRPGPGMRDEGAIAERASTNGLPLWKQRTRYSRRETTGSLLAIGSLLSRLISGLDAHASSRPLASPAMRAMPAGAWLPSSPSRPTRKGRRVAWLRFLPCTSPPCDPRPLRQWLCRAQDLTPSKPDSLVGGPAVSLANSSARAALRSVLPSAERGSVTKSLPYT